MSLKNILFPSKEEKMQKVMRDVNESSFVLNGAKRAPNPNQYDIKRYEKRLIRDINRAEKLGCQIKEQYGELTGVYYSR
jgi:hypothetical protein